MSNPLHGTGDVELVGLSADDKALRVEILRHTREIEKILKNQGKRDYVEPTGSKLSLSYWRARYRVSKIQSYLHTEDTDVDDIDAAVNTLAIVSALLVTVPFGVVTSFDHTYWDWLESVPCASTVQKMGGVSYFHFYQTNFIKQIYLSLFASILGVGLTAFYYMLRPSDTELFRFWWKRGRYVVMVMFLCAFITTIMTMSMAGWVLNGWYVVSTKGFCDSPGDFTFSRQFATAGITINFLVLLISAIVMF
jgi:hypothetical protein